jgi:hypothetical protein
MANTSSKRSHPVVTNLSVQIRGIKGYHLIELRHTWPISFPILIRVSISRLQYYYHYVTSFPPFSLSQEAT